MNYLTISCQNLDCILLLHLENNYSNQIIYMMIVLEKTYYQKHMSYLFIKFVLEGHHITSLSFRNL